MPPRALRPLRFDEGTGYYFIIDTDYRQQLMPPKKELEGVGRRDLKDANGRFFVRDMIDLAKAQKDLEACAPDSIMSWSRLFPAVGLVDGRAGIEKVLKQIEKCASKQGALGSGWRVNGLIMAMGAAAENGDCDLLAALKKRGGSERDLRAMGNLPECR